MQKKSKLPERTEEVQHIIDRMPTKFGYWATAIVLFTVISAFILSWVISYHDVVTGNITVNANNAPVKLIANTSGKIILNAKSQSNVFAEEYIGYINNAAHVNDVKLLIKIINSIDINSNEDIYKKKELLMSTKFSLGELNIKYFQFLNSLNLLVNYQRDGYYATSKNSLKKVLSEYEKMLIAITAKAKYNKDYSLFYKKFLNRDSSLLSKNAISEVEFNKSELNYLSSLSTNESAENEISQILLQIENSKGKLQQLDIEEREKAVQLKLEMVSAYSDLKDNIKAWEEKYIFKSPIDGKVQFLKFWNNNHFIRAGEPVFTVISNDKYIYGQVMLPNAGSGKVKIGQDVIIKLDDYPYMEFGSVTGKVKLISLSTLSKETQEGNKENYMVYVELPKDLITNYGNKLSNKNEITGVAEIITNNRKLIQRFFERMQYLVNN